jgi:hypothetical protein
VPNPAFGLEQRAVCSATARPELAQGRSSPTRWRP